MLLREDGDAVVAIGQASHAWVSGQLARAWAWPVPEPREELCLAAEQHDVGMAEWDLAPDVHPGTGRPLQFFEVPRPVHVELWSHAAEKLLTQSRHAALLVSLHGTGLYERFPPREPEHQELVRAHLAAQRALQDRLAEEVGAAREDLRTAQRLLAAWDDLSLSLCFGRDRDVPDVPGPGGAPVALALRGTTLDPWPFAAGEVALRAEGRRLAGRAAGRDELRAMLDAAPHVPLRWTLRPA
ncbi:MAG: DUF3891 family protein [Solirubrobacterales bacterium]|nr:DUF3891 family protein [Solirubrobacterales bacterium]